MKFLAFDIEIAAIVKGTDWKAFRPLGISVAATMPSGEKPRLWYGEGRPNDQPLPRMPRAQVQVLVAYLQERVREGFTICTWNGLRFDFDILAEESGLVRECAELALDHVDPMFHFFCEQGWAFGLKAAARGIGLNKTEGMDGALAPVLWAAGQYAQIMDYVIQDVQITLAVTEAAHRYGSLPWMNSKGRPMRWDIRGSKLLTCREALQLPEPAPPAWIKDPWRRADFTTWMV